MTTKELIELLKKLDPTGKMEIWIDGCFYDCPEIEVVKCESKNNDGETIREWIEIQ